MTQDLSSVQLALVTHTHTQRHRHRHTHTHTHTHTLAPHQLIGACNWHSLGLTVGVFTLVTRGRFFDVGVKI